MLSFKIFKKIPLFLTIGLTWIVLVTPGTEAVALNGTALRANHSLSRIIGKPVYKNLLIPTPRDFFLGNGNQIITDIQNILNTLTGGNAVGGTGTVVFIIVATATAIFWIIIFLIIYYSIYAKKEKEEGGYGGGGYGYGEMKPQSFHHGHGHGRGFIPAVIMNRITDTAWKAFDKLTSEYGKL